VFELAYVGALVPDREPFNSPPFSRSANLYQAQMLDGMAAGGARPSLILSYTAAQSYPRDKRLWVKGGVVTDERGNRIRVLGFPNITPVKQAWLGAAAFARLTAWSLRRLGRPRVIHAYNLTTPSGIFLWLAARATGAKISVSLCDVEVPGERVPNTLPFRLDYWMHGFLIPRLDGRVVVADAIAEDFAPAHHYLRLEGGVGDELIARTEKVVRSRAPHTGPFRIVAVGNLNETNGFDLILDAMERLAGADVVLDIAGYGPLAERVEEAARRDPRIRMHGFQPLDAILELYGKADLILVIRRTTTHDTRYFFPGKLMEALLAGVPVLATRTGHLEEEYGSSLYLLDEETPEALAARIRELAAIPESEHRALATRARTLMTASKSWRAQAGRLVEYLRDKVVR
jgi:glycosyltransferase involved in cell wall biosynthesis